MQNKKFTFKISIESNVAYLPIVRKVIRAACASFVPQERIFEDIDICLNEALSNVIHYAYKNEPGNEIQIAITAFPDELLIQISDIGLENSLGEPPLKIDDNFEDISQLSESGRGLFLIHQLMDKVSYSRENGKNTLTLTKKLV